jgi:hypothetical protein
MNRHPTSRLLLPSEERLRQDILQQLQDYCELEKTSWSAVGQAITGDMGLFFRIARGQNITFSTYERIRAWFEEHWPK